ncbi:MAG: hypothetical protein OTJ97_00380 [SAR202 cluster bacterium]|nr:hypothetical protein [SAR202 cluster bacterium]
MITERSLHRIIVAAFATVLLVAACSTSEPVPDPTATSVLLPPVIPTALPTPERLLVDRNILLPTGPGNPRNSEGDFIELTAGRIMFAYPRFTGRGRDQDAADIAARFSSDDATWTAAGRPSTWLFPGTTVKPGRTRRS